MKTPKATKISENKMESSGYKGDGEPSTSECNLPIANITMIATKLTNANANNAIAFFFNDLILFSSLTFLNEACNNSIAQIDMKHDKKSGNDLVASLNAESIEPQTIEPIQSAKAYIALRNVYPEKTKKTMRAKEMTRDCLFCLPSKADKMKLSLLKNFFIRISPKL